MCQANNLIKKSETQNYDDVILKKYGRKIFCHLKIQARF